VAARRINGAEHLRDVAHPQQISQLANDFQALLNRHRTNDTSRSVKLSVGRLHLEADLRGYWIVIVSSMEQTYLLRYLNIK
jgi:hypothetical protein